MKPLIIEYKQIQEGRPLKLRIFNPPNHSATNKTPAIVFFFGGGWINFAPTQFYRQSRYLASKGMVAICADYRTKKVHGTTPQECVKDGKSAIRWIRSHATELGIDPNRLAAGGGSAGGHIAAAAGTLDGFNEAGEDLSVSCRPDALVLFNPVYNNGPDGYGYDRVKAYWKEFSPMHNIDSNTPPTIVLFGTRDKFTPPAVAKKYKQLMESAGVRSELILYEGEVHGFFNKTKYEETLKASEEFLTSLGYLNP